MSRTSLNSDFPSVSAGTGRYVSKGEDKDFSRLSHVEQDLPEYGSFGVFDGHYGSRSASLCAQHMNPAIMANTKKLEDKLYRVVKTLREDPSYSGDPVIHELIEFLMSEDMRDAILLESMRASAQIMDCELRRVDKSGTTAVSLFVRKQREGEGLRVLVSNIGDSRCVLFAPKKGMICKNASSASLSTVDSAEAKYDEGPSSLSKVTGAFMKLMKNSPLGGGLKKRDAEKLTAFCSSRDHSLTHAGERLRVSKHTNVNIDWHPFPVDVLSASSREVGVTDGPVEYIGSPSSPGGAASRRIEVGNDGESLDDSLNGAGEDMINYDDLNQSVHFEQDVVPFLDGTGSKSPKSARAKLKALNSNVEAFSPFGVPIGSPANKDRKSLSTPIPIGKGGGSSRRSSNHCDSLADDSDDENEKSKISVLDPLQKESLSRTPEEAVLIDSFFCGGVITEDYHATRKYIEKAREILCHTDFPVKSIQTLLATATLRFFDDETEFGDSGGVLMSSGTVDEGVFQYDPRDVTRHGGQAHRLGLSEKITPVDVDVTQHADLAEGFKTIRSNSLISTRVSSSGVKGPEALFGRFKISVSMTRSLGGRYGPRRCICLPDVIGLDVLPGQRIRCVLATDGLWDVVSLTSIAKVLNRHSAPTMAAKALTEKALKRREDRGLRLDDITVVVVDVQVQGTTEDTTPSTSL